MKNLATKLEPEIQAELVTEPVDLRIVKPTVKESKRDILKVEEGKEFVKEYSYRAIKRAVDIVGAIVGIIFLLPIMGIVKIAYIKDGDKSPILFKQKRIGKNGKEIEVYKVRSMVMDAENLLMEMLENNPQIREEYETTKKLKNDPRITKVGKFIRKTSLDEFAQFINVLKGDMTLVGPRPYLPREKEDMKGYYDEIIGCKPGVTGLWQVEGRSKLSFANRCRLDSFYNKHKGLVFDFKIFIKTFLVVLKQDGAI